MSYVDRLFYDIWFHNSKIPSNIKINLLNEGIDPEVIWGYKAIDFMELGLNMSKVDDILRDRNDKSFEEIEEYLAKENITYIMYNDSLYPIQLKNIQNPPIGLFVKGEIPQTLNSIGIVGARRASQYGKTTAYKLAYELSGYGITIISGMARGVDASSHSGTIDGKGKTIAVMGSGFKNIYPQENIKLYEAIINNGCVITEFMPDELPFPVHFPMRNRIISGLSTYILVVEAGDKSGSLTTANLALEQGKDVFAVPGNIFSPNSVGTNKLIRDGAKIITNVQDILVEFGENIKNTFYDELDNKEKKLLSILNNGAATLELIIEECQESSDKVLSIIGKLECMGIIKRVYGNYYIIA